MSLRGLMHAAWPAAGVAFGVAMVLVIIIGHSRAVEPLERDQTRLERRFATLQQEHRELQRWVIERFRPWVERQVDAVAEAPPGVTPSVEPPPSPPATPAPTIAPPTPSPQPTPPLSPSPEPSPSDICLPIVCEPPSEGGEA